MHTGSYRSIEDIRIWDAPAFALLLGYVWIEMCNPLVGYMFQLIPKIPNSAIAVILCYLFKPGYLNAIRVPFNPVKWALPFLIIATINLPLVRLEQEDAIRQLTSTWFWVLLLIPLMVRVLAIPSGRWHYVLFTTISVTGLAIQFILSLIQFDFAIIEGIEFSRNTLAPPVLAIFPIIIGYLYHKRGVSRYFLLISLTIISISILVAGARAAWILLPLELLLLVLFVLPRSIVLLSISVFSIFLYLIISFTDISSFLPGKSLDYVETRVRQTEDWKDDDSVWARFAVVIKVKKILEEHPFFGVGYSNKSFASFNAGTFDFFGHQVHVRRIDAHNTYWNILGGTGILGFIAFFYYMKKVFFVSRQIIKKMRKTLDTGPFLVSAAVTFIYYNSITYTFATLAMTTMLVVSVFVYQYNLQLYKLSLFKSNLEKSDIS